jgi:hypothetical protein
MVCRDVREHLVCAGRYWPLTLDAYRHEFEERAGECELAQQSARVSSDRPPAG